MEQEGRHGDLPEGLLRTVLEVLESGVVVVGPHGRILRANPAARRILGLTDVQMVGRPVADPTLRATHPDGTPWPAETHPIRVAAQTGRMVHGELMGVHRPDGSLVWIDVSAAPLTGPDGQPIGAVATFVDVTEREETARILRDRERRLRSAQDLTGLAWWEYDVLADEHVWSDRMFELVGLDPADGPPDLEGWLALIHPDDHEAARRRSDPGLPRPVGSNLFRVVLGDGRVRTLQAWDDVEKDAEGRVVRVFGTTMDVTEREEAARRLAESESRLRAAQELTGLAWWEWDIATGNLNWSTAMHRLAGLDVGMEHTIDEWLALVHPEDRAASALLERRALETGEGYRHVFRITRPDGELRFLESWTDVLRRPDGTPYGLRGATHDVTLQETAQREIAASEELFRVAFDNAPIGMTMLGIEGEDSGRVLRANDAACRILGVTPGDFARMRVADWTPPEDRAESEDRIRRLMAGEVVSLTYDKNYLHSSGRLIPALVTTGVIHDAVGRPRYLVTHIVDMTERHAHQAELERLATTDSLTDLANRARLEQRLADSLTTASPQQPVGLLLLDLDRFKLVNDSLGHQVGDGVLARTADVLRDLVPAPHLVARLGGDEFAVVMSPAPAEQPDELATALLDRLRAPQEHQGSTLVVTGSIGLARADSHLTTAADLLRAADLALYHAKDHGRDRVSSYDETLRSRVLDAVRVEGVLRGALDRGGIAIAVQPIVGLGGSHFAAVEALARVVEPDGTVLVPARFLEVAEDSGLVGALDRQVVSRAVAWLGAADRQVLVGGAPHLVSTVSVNVSGRTLRLPGYVDTVAAALNESGLDPSRLWVEITEATLVGEDPELRRGLTRLRELGVRIGLDDFGTGYSALSYLSRLDLDFLKVDRTFVSAMAGDDATRTLMEAVLRIAHAHRLRVVAEGVETPEQARLLTEMGYDAAQGFWFGSPELVDEDRR